MNQFNVETEIGWNAAVALASRFGWRDGHGLEKKMSRKDLEQAMLVNARLVGLKVGHVEELHRIYGASFWSGRYAFDKREERFETKRSSNVKLD